MHRDGNRNSLTETFATLSKDAVAVHRFHFARRDFITSPTDFFQVSFLDGGVDIGFDAFVDLLDKLGAGGGNVTG